MGCCGPKDEDTFVSPLLKYLLFFFNFFFWLVGGGLIGIGTWAYVENQRLGASDNSSIENFYDLLFDVTIIIIVVGVFVFILAFCGCVGALRENVILLKIFSIFLAIIFLAEVIGAVLAFVFRAEVKDGITDVLKNEAIVRYRDDLNLQNLIDWFQKNLECCGVGSESYKEWSLNQYFNCSDSNPSAERCAVPYSCCVKPNTFDEDIINTMCGWGVQSKDSLFEVQKVTYATGCVQAFLVLAEDNLIIVGAVAIGVAIPQLLGIFLARILASQIEDQRDRWA